LDSQYLASIQGASYLQKDTEILSDIFSVQIDWSEELGKKLWNQYLTEHRITTNDPALQGQLDNLLFVIEKINRYYGIDWSEVIRRTLLEGPAFAKYQKKFLDNCFNLHHLDKSDTIEGYFPINSYKEYFPQYILPFWKEECNDIVYSFLPTKTLSKKVEKEFKEALLSILPDNVDLNINLDRFIEHFSTTSSYIMSEDKTLPHLVQAWKKVPSIPKEYNCKRCKIPIEPGNTRDAVVLEPDALFAVEVMGQRVLRLLRRIPQSLMGRDNTSLVNRIKYLLLKGTKHSTYRRDYKKEGLARPQRLFELTLEVLSDKYPSYFEDFYLFLRYNLRLDEDVPGIGVKGEILHPTRGTGLGMMNEIVTLISIAISEMVLNRIEREVTPNIREKIIYGIWNDDSCFIGKYKHTEVFRQVDIQVHNDLDYILSEEKCVILKNGCWILGLGSSETFDCNVDYFYRVMIWSKMHCKNICFAKQFIRSLTYPMSVMDTVEEFINNFGYEFYPEESSQPAAFGGWLKPRERGIDTTLNSIDAGNIELLIRQFKGYLAEQEHPTRMKLTRMERLLKENEFRGTEFRFSFLSLELVKNKFFDFSNYFTDADSLKKRLVLSMTMKERSDDYWRISSRLRVQKYRERLTTLKNLEVTLTNLYLEKQAGRLVDLPKKWILKKTRYDFLCQYKYWFPEIKNPLDTVELYHRAQLRLEPENNKNVIHSDLIMDHLLQLDVIMEPKANVVMEGALPWSRNIDKRFLEWCPNPFLLLNHMNRNKVEIRLCNIPTEISELIKLPLKPSYYFANDRERKILDLANKHYDCLLEMSDAIIWNEFRKIEVDIHGHEVNWTTPKYVKIIRKMLHKHKMSVDIDDTHLSISLKYRECQRIEDEQRKASTYIEDEPIVFPDFKIGKDYDYQWMSKNFELKDGPEETIELEGDEPQEYNMLGSPDVSSSDDEAVDEDKFYEVKISLDAVGEEQEEVSSREEDSYYLDSSGGNESTDEEISDSN